MKFKIGDKVKLENDELYSFLKNKVLIICGIVNLCYPEFELLEFIGNDNNCYHSKYFKLFKNYKEPKWKKYWKEN